MSERNDVPRHPNDEAPPDSAGDRLVSKIIGAIVILLAVAIFVDTPTFGPPEHALYAKWFLRFAIVVVGGAFLLGRRRER